MGENKRENMNRTRENKKEEVKNVMETREKVKNIIREKESEKETLRTEERLR